jgi:DNA-binding NarL/FixJ family response regulator
MDELTATIDIVIADDHAILREGVHKLLECEPGLRVIGEAADGEEAVRVVRQAKPHVLLMGLAMPKMTGFEVLRELSKLKLATRTIILTGDIERDQVAEALQLGASGIVLKRSTLQVLLECIRSVSAGKHWVDQGSVPDLIQAVRGMAPPHPVSPANQHLGVTPREMQIIALIVAGYTNKDLAQKLRISENTAKHHLTNIFNKLGVSNRLELVLYAIDHQLVASE